MTLRFLFVLLAALAVAPGAQAQKNVRYSSLPYWEVGVLDPQLSTLCANGQFNLADMYAFSYVFKGPVGPAVLGVARFDWNLLDPSHAAKPSASYYFLRDRTTNCQVFRWGPNDQRRTMGPPSDFSKQAQDPNYQYRIVTEPGAQPTASGIN